MFLAEVMSPTAWPGPYTGRSVAVVRASSPGWQSPDGLVLPALVGGVATAAAGIVVVSGARDVGGAPTASPVFVVVDDAGGRVATWLVFPRVNTSRVATTSRATIPA